MNDNRTKACEICRQIFPVDRRVGARQRVCRRLECQQERKRRYLCLWLANDPDYYQRRYSGYLKDWLTAHPGYLKRYRQAKRQNGGRSRDDIQVELNSCQTEVSAPAAPSADKQAQITFRITKAHGAAQTVARDIQVQLSP
ncbi:MAG: hypothetical protein ACREOO_09490 [bacterium]